MTKGASAGSAAAKKTLNTAEVARVLKCSRAMVYKFRFQGRVKAERVDGLVRYDRESVEALAKVYAPSPHFQTRHKPPEELPGNVAARVYEVMSAKPEATIDELVMETKASPQVIMRLARLRGLSPEEAYALELEDRHIAAQEKEEKERQQVARKQAFLLIKKGAQDRVMVPR